jgi:hypothetical protein
MPSAVVILNNSIPSADVSLLAHPDAPSGMQFEWNASSVRLDELTDLAYVSAKLIMPPSAI